MEKDHSAKHLPHYYGPMVIISCLKNHSYHLGELDGSVAAKRYVGFRLIPYYPHNLVNIPVTQILEREVLEQTEVEEGQVIEDEEDREYISRRRSEWLAEMQG